MTPSVLRLFTVWAYFLLVLGACAAPGSGVQKTINALGLIAITVVIEGAILASALVFGVSMFRSSADKFAMFLGVFVGCLASAVIIVSVPLNIQYMVVGGILGLGTNLFASKNQAANVKTAIGSLAKLVTTTVKSVSSAAADTGLPTPQERALTVGIWCFLGTILLTLAIGNAVSGVTLFAGNAP